MLNIVSTYLVFVTTTYIILTITTPDNHAEPRKLSVYNKVNTRVPILPCVQDVQGISKILDFVPNFLQKFSSQERIKFVILNSGSETGKFLLKISLFDEILRLDMAN